MRVTDFTYATANRQDIIFLVTVHHHARNTNLTLR